MKSLCLLGIGLVWLATAGLRAQETNPPLATGDPSGSAAAAAALASPAQVLEPGDKIQFFIEEDPVKGGGPVELLVSSLGDLYFPVSRNSDVVISVNVKGKTAAAVKEELKTRLDADYYQNATVFLKIFQALGRRGQVTFAGEVRQTILPIDPGQDLTLFQAILRVAPTDFARLNKVRLNRYNPATQKTDTTTHDVEVMIQKGDRSQDVKLQDGDHIVVPQKMFNFQ